MEEITAEYRAQALVAAEPLRVRPVVTIACKTDLGRARENNEDKFEYFLAGTDGELAARGHLFLVCDGMGGHAAGQIASELAIKTFVDVYRSHPAQNHADALGAAVAAANRFVYDVANSIPSRRGMGTTLTGVALIQDRAWLVQVGDSRCYRIRGGAIEQLSHDHTWVEEAVRQGLLDASAAATHPHRNVLTRAIGTESDVRADIASFDVQIGDLFILCSDGLTGHVSDDRLLTLFAQPGLCEAVWRAVGAALADGGTDNCTVLAFRVDDLVDVVA